VQDSIPDLRGYDRLQQVIKDALRSVGSRIIYIREESYPEPEYGPTLEEAHLPDVLIKALKIRGLHRLYKFQYRALEEVRKGNNVAIVSGTGTGKTEAFLIPTLEQLINECGECIERPYALILYPTKALARDQVARIKSLVEDLLGLRVGVLDGDTPRREREKIYGNPPHILVSNPDMMHIGLAYSGNIRRLISRISILILDEIHVYRGVFGSHMRWVVYRIKAHSTSDIQLISSGATVGNPRELSELIFDDVVEVVEGPLRRRGKALHVFVDQGRTSRWTTTASIVARLAKEGLKVLGFVESQQMAELIARILVKSFGVRVGVHRAGLLPEERKRIEQDFWSGRLRAVIATPTLELGIDIGDLDAVVMAHLPKSYSSYLQRAGRAGRRQKTGLVITVLGDDPIEAYFSRKPQEYFKQEVDPSYLEPYNSEVMKVHLVALLMQNPRLKLDDLPKPLREVIKDLEGTGIARVVKGRLIVERTKARAYIESHSSLRSSGPQVRILDANSRKVIGFREMPQALYDLHPGAIYYHSGIPYISVGLNVDKLEALVRKVPSPLEVYTKPLYNVNVIDIIPLEDKRAGPLRLVYGELRISISVDGYMMKDEYRGITLSEVKFREPITWSYWTKGLITRFPDAGIKRMVDLISGYHALEHTLISASRPLVGASEADLGGISYPSGHIVIYDSAPGGHGASRLVYERFEKVEALALKILSGCTCVDGCPRCVYSPYCGSGNRFLSRRNALKILLEVLEGGRPVGDEPINGEPLS